MGVRLLLLVACEAPPVEESAGETAAPAVAVLTDAHNYGYEATLSLAVHETGPWDLTKVSWTSLTADLAGRSLEPQDVGQVLLLWLPTMEPAEIEAQLAYGELLQKQMSATFGFMPGGRTEMGLGEFQRMDGTEQLSELYAPDTGSWLMVLMLVGRPGYAAAAILQPTDQEIFEVALATGDSSFTLTAAAGETFGYDATLPLDWSAVTTGASGRALAETPPDVLWIGRYDLTPDEVMADFVVAEELAVDHWMLELGATDSVESLTLAEGPGGTFPGFDTDATWALALRCMFCIAAAPPFATFVVPS